MAISNEELGKRRGKDYFRLPAKMKGKKRTTEDLQKLLAMFIVSLQRGSTDFFTRTSAKQISRELIRRHYAKRPLLYFYWLNYSAVYYFRLDRVKRSTRLISRRKESRKQSFDVSAALSTINIISAN